MTDIRQLMREIEEGLTALHQAQRDALPPSTSTPGQDEGQGPQDAVADPETPPDAGQKEEEGQGMEEEEFLAQCPPFLLVDEVAADSPAKQAGLQVCLTDTRSQTRTWTQTQTRTITSTGTCTHRTHTESRIHVC